MWEPDKTSRDKNCMGCFVRGGKSLWDVLSRDVLSYIRSMLVHHYLIFLLYFFLPTLMSHRATQISYQHFLIISLAFKLAFQNHFHGLSSLIVRLLSDQCVSLNFGQQLTAIFLTTSAIYTRPPPPPKQREKKCIKK